METTENNTIETTRKVLEEYKLDGPVPEDQRNYFYINRRKSFINVLKLNGTYSLWKGLGSYVFFGCTRFGLQLSMFQSGVIMVIAGAISAAAISTGGYFAVKKLLLNAPEEKPVQIEEAAAAAPAAPVVSEKPETVKAKPKPFTLYLNIDGYGNIDNKTTANISKKVKRHFIKNGISINKKYIVSGEVKAIEGNYYAKIRVFSNKVKQVYFKRDKFKNIDDLQDFFIRESIKIAEKVQ
ncbi:MAG: hypothetical protein GY754_43435 [bacterium]|nr:hypothetical protein [bacterium]